MSDMWIPSLSGIARMNPKFTTVYSSNVGTAATVTGYTTPTGKIAHVTSWNVGVEGGVAPTLLWGKVVDATSTLVMIGIHKPNPVVLEAYALIGDLWLPEGYSLTLSTTGGDATTDLRQDIAVVEYDWVDVT